MTTEEIERKIGIIVDLVAKEVYDEEAHILEDQLRHAFIVHVATHGSDELKAMARLVLSTTDLDFCRWYA